MKLFKPFRTRSAARDEETDRRRFERLSTMLSSLHDEIEQEQQGLRRRYEKSQHDAGFALEVLDRTPSNEKLAESVEQHSETLLKCEARLQALQAQTGLLTTIGDLLDARCRDASPNSSSHP